jgi:hypothetical protein
VAERIRWMDQVGIEHCLYALLFLAFWLAWTTFMLYGNAAAGHTHVIRLDGV